MTPKERKALEAILSAIDAAEQENSAVGNDDWYARAELLGALQVCRRGIKDALAMRDEPVRLRSFDQEFRDALRPVKEESGE